MLRELTPDEHEEFLEYLIGQLPVGFIAMTYQDFIHIKEMKQIKKIGKITNADINRLELQLKINKFDKIKPRDIE